MTSLKNHLKVETFQKQLTTVRLQGLAEACLEEMTAVGLLWTDP